MPNEIGHLKRLSAIRSGKNIKFLTPAVYSGGWCPMRVACNICEDIKGLSYLMVGMPECATYSRGMSSLPEGSGGELRRIYTLDANEVVFGCRAGLAGALREMVREGAKAILMIATCVTDLIGEDMEGLISEIQPEIGVRLSFVTLGQFKNFGSSAGAWKTAEAIVSLMKLPPASTPTTVRKANALFIDPWRNKNEAAGFPLFVGELADAGVRIRRLTTGVSLDEYLDAPDAALNLVLSELTQPMAAKMESAFGIPYAPLHNAFKVADIDAVYDRIAETLGINWREGFDRGWRRAALAMEDKARSALDRKKYAAIPGAYMPAALAEYLADFGAAPLLLNIEDFHNEDPGYAKRLKAGGYDPPVCRMMNIDYDIEIVRRLEPDFCIGGVPDDVEGILCADYMGDFFGVVGYERTAGILKRIITLLETGDIGERLDMYGPAPF